MNDTELYTSCFVAVGSKHLEADLPVLALEGQSYAGKSSALVAFQQAGYGTVREYAELRRRLPAHTSVAPRQGIPLSPEQEKEDFLFYLEIERLRYQMYLGLPRSCAAVFLDRSIFTLFAYRVAIQVPPDIFTWAVQAVVSDTTPILSPHHVIYIDIPLDLARQRHACSGTHLPAYFLETAFYERFRFFFLVLAESQPSRITIIDGSQDRETTVQQIYSIAQAKGFLANR
jgi:thymidylate kinase